MERLKNRQTRSSTSATYLSIWRHLNKFILRLDHREKIYWEDRTALFGAYLVDKGVQSSTLRSYFSAIKHILKQDGYPWDDNKALLSSLVRGCKLENDQLKVRLPIQRGLFEMILFELERRFSNNTQPYLEIMCKALFSLAYYGMLRVGELPQGDHTVKACNIHVGNNKDKILVVLYSSKTHGIESRPQKVKISAVKTTISIKKNFCPFSLVLQYMMTRGPFLENHEQFFVFGDKSPVKAFHVRDVLRSILTDLNLNAELYDVHSFRIRRTCDLDKFGYSIEQIKSMGRWKSNAVYKYLRR